MNTPVRPLDNVFLSCIIKYFPDCSNILKFVFINKKCGEIPKFTKLNPFFLRDTIRDCNSCVKFIREFKLFPAIDTLVINCSYFRTFKTHQIMKQIKFIRIYDLPIKNISFLNGCEDKIEEIGLLVDSETVNLTQFPNIHKAHLSIKNTIPFSVLFPNKQQKLEMMKLNFINNNLPGNLIKELEEYKGINKIIITSNTKPTEEMKDKRIAFFYTGWTDKFESGFICKSIKFMLKRNEEGCDYGELQKVMKVYYPFDIKLNMKDEFNINWKYDINELRMSESYDDYFCRRHKGDHDFQDCIEEGYSVSEEYVKEKQEQTEQEKQEDDEFNIDDIVGKQESNEKTKHKEEAMKRREMKKKEAQKRKEYFPMIIKPTEIDLSQYTQLKNIETKSDIIGIKAPENYRDGIFFNFNSNTPHLKRDEQKVFSSIRRNMDFTKETFTNAKMVKCKLLQKTLFPTTLKRLTLEDCEIATYKSGTCFQLPKCVTCLTLKGNIDQQLLHIERIPLIELQLLETPFVDINPFPQTLTKIKLMDINSSRLMNFQSCTLTSLELLSCVKAGFVLPNLRLFRAENSNVYIKNIDSIKVRRCELFRCFINDQNKLICDHLFSFDDICDTHNNPFFETCFEELPFAKSNSSSKSPSINTSSNTISNSNQLPQFNYPPSRLTPTNPFSRSADDSIPYNIQPIPNDTRNYHLPPPTNTNYYSPFLPLNNNYRNNYQQFNSQYHFSSPSNR